MCEHGKRKAMCKLCGESSSATADLVPPSATACALIPPKKLTREDYFKMLLESAPCTMTTPAPPANIFAASLPNFLLPTAADSFASMLSAATAFSSLDMLKFIDSASVPSAAFALPGTLPFMHPFAAPLLLGVNPLLQPQFGSASNFQAFDAFNAALNPSSFGTHT